MCETNERIDCTPRPDCSLTIDLTYTEFNCVLHENEKKLISWLQDEKKERFAGRNKYVRSKVRLQDLVSIFNIWISFALLWSIYELNCFSFSLISCSARIFPTLVYLQPREQGKFFILPFLADLACMHACQQTQSCMTWEEEWNRSGTAWIHVSHPVGLLK